MAKANNDYLFFCTWRRTEGCSHRFQSLTKCGLLNGSKKKWVKDGNQVLTRQTALEALSVGPIYERCFAFLQGVMHSECTLYAVYFWKNVRKLTGSNRISLLFNAHMLLTEPWTNTCHIRNVVILRRTGPDQMSERMNGFLWKCNEEQKLWNALSTFRQPVV